MIFFCLFTFAEGTYSLASLDGYDRNVALLSFEDDAPEDDGEGTSDSKPIKKKMLSSHDVLEDDPTLSREVDPSLKLDQDELNSDRQRNATNGSSLDSEREKERSTGKVSTSEPSEDNESVNAFDQRMRDQVREKMKKARMARESESSQADVPALETASATTAALPIATPLTPGERVRQEIQKLEGDIRKMHNRGGEAETKKKGSASKVSLLQLEREQYTTRAESKGSKRSKSSKSTSSEKDRELLERLSSFEAKLFSVAKEPEPNPAPKKNDAPPCKIHGVPSCESCVDTTAGASRKKRKASSDDNEASSDDDDSDDDVGWMQHKLVFEKDLKGKEVSLAAKRDDADEYIVIDPLNKAASTTAALALEQQKKLDKMKRNSRFTQADNKDRDRRLTHSSLSSIRRDDRPYDRSSRDTPSSSHRQGDERRSGYDRRPTDSRDRRGGRDSYSSQDRRDGRDNRSGNDRR